MTTRKVYLDVESVGLVGPCKLIQYAIDNGPVHMIKLFRGWEGDKEARQKVQDFLALLDEPETLAIAYNAAFDMFHMYRLAHRLKGYGYDSPERPVMPFRCSVLDLQVPALQYSPLAPFAFNKKGVAMIRRIPKIAKSYVKDLVLKKLRPLIPQSLEIKVSEKKEAQDDLVSLSFNVNGRVALKALMQEYGIETIKLDDVWPLPKKGTEATWLPYPDPKVHGPIEEKCDEILRRPDSDPFFTYAQLDILFLKVLEAKLNYPAPDYNSALTHNVAYTRYYGFPLDLEALKRSEVYYHGKVAEIEEKLTGINPRSSKQRLELLKPYFPEIQSTSKNELKKLQSAEGPGGDLVRAILEYGAARQRLLQIQKVLECRTGRAHAELRVCGTATDRFSGAAGLNYQGIGQAVGIDEEDLIDYGYEGSGGDNELMDEELQVGLREAILTPSIGDWASFEVVIAATVYQDEDLFNDIRNGIDLHSAVSVAAHPKMIAEGVTYDDFRAAYVDHSHPKHSEYNAIRKGIKSIVFGIFYGASAMKVGATLGLDEAGGEEVLNRLYNKYKGIGRYRAKVEKDFLTADTTNWSPDSVAKMASEMEALTGYTRRWHLEKAVACALWGLGQGGQIQSGLVGEVIRTPEKGKQTIDMAITSACLGSAISLQAAVARQAVNFRIQATGAGLTKQLQARVWEETRVPTLSIHDELVVSSHPNYNATKYASLIDSFVEEAQALVPLVKFDYSIETTRWSDK